MNRLVLDSTLSRSRRRVVLSMSTVTKASILLMTSFIGQVLASEIGERAADETDSLMSEYAELISCLTAQLDQGGIVIQVDQGVTSESFRAALLDFDRDGSCSEAERVSKSDSVPGSTIP